MVKQIIAVEAVENTETGSEEVSEATCPQLDVWCDEVSLPREAKTAQEIVLNLKETIREHNLPSLSAPQIGYNKRIFVVNFNGDLRSFINPVITKADGITLSDEVCPSLPGRRFVRPRNNTIVVAYQTPLGRAEVHKFLGLAAIVIQHELDHLNGLLLSDVALEVDSHWDEATQEERDEVLAAYLDSIDLKKKVLHEQIEDNKDLKQLSDGIRFLEAVASGEVKLAPDAKVLKADFRK